MSVWPREADAPETLEDFDAWAGDLRGHRAAYRESSFRWDHNDVLTLISWATGGRLEFTTTDHLRFLEHARVRLRDEMRAARMDTAPHIARAAAAGGSAETAQALGMPQATVERLAAPHDPKNTNPRHLFTAPRSACTTTLSFTHGKPIRRG